MGHRILIVSDSTGSTAEHVVQAALAQFEAQGVALERRPETRSIDAIRAVVVEAHESGSMLVHTFPSPPGSTYTTPQPCPLNFASIMSSPVTNVSESLTSAPRAEFWND